MCGKPKPKSKPKSKPKARAEPKTKVQKGSPPEPKKVDAFAAMRAMAKPIEKKESAPKSAEGVSDETFNRAIKALEPILHPIEKARYRAVLDETPSLEERKRRWEKKIETP